MHSVHPAEVDGVDGPAGTIMPDQNFTYTFTAKPYGVYPYHCHVNPVGSSESRAVWNVHIPFSIYS